MNKFIRKYFSLILLATFFLGLISPDIGEYTAPVIIAALILIIFTSFFKIDLSRKALLENTRKALIFYVLRFIALPVLIFFLLVGFSDFYAISALLVFLLPAAVASPAFTDLFKANVNLSLNILIYSSFLSILSIPLFTSLLIGDSVDIDRVAMFKTLVITIVIPFVVHLPLRRVAVIREAMLKSNSILTVIGLIVMLLVAVAQHKTVLLEDIGIGLEYAFASLLMYAALYLVGWWLFMRAHRDDKVTFSVSSGANNIGLGITLTALYFSPSINIFFIIAQLSWVLLLIPLRWWYRVE